MQKGIALFSTNEDAYRTVTNTTITVHDTIWSDKQKYNSTS